MDYSLSHHQLSLLSTGQGVFETIQYSEGIIWFLEDHLKRLVTSAASLGIVILPDNIKNEIYLYLKNINSDLKIKVIILFPFLNKNPSQTKVDIIIQTSPLESRDKSKTISLLTSNSPYFPEFHPAAIKTINYGPYFIKKNQAQQTGYDDVLFIDYQSRLLESSTANIFGLIKNTILTPPLTLNILPGIIRSILINQFEVIEKDIYLDEIENFDMFFLTNSIIELQPIQQIDHIRFQKNNKQFIDILNKWDIFKKKYKQKDTFK